MTERKTLNFSPYASGTYDYEHSHNYLEDTLHLEYLLPLFMRNIYQKTNNFLDRMEYKDSPLTYDYYDKETIYRYAGLILKDFLKDYPDISLFGKAYESLGSKELKDIISAVLVPMMFQRKIRYNNIINRSQTSTVNL